ncbi:hypothetical protein GQ457_18G000690 [Hibiscus cannabinus]
MTNNTNESDWNWKQTRRKGCPKVAGYYLEVVSMEGPHNRETLCVYMKARRGCDLMLLGKSECGSGSMSQRRSIKKRCLTMAKQQRGRFYILRRCVSMLLCWHLHSISD